MCTHMYLKNSFMSLKLECYFTLNVQHAKCFVRVECKGKKRVECIQQYKFSQFFSKWLFWIKKLTFQSLWSVVYFFVSSITICYNKL